ncbi:MAG: FAD:protein FMN transferase [Clostridiales bacterium]|nr:FAD:protein FMN transferase [Clostridiales bacterium]
MKVHVLLTRSPDKKLLFILAALLAAGISCRPKERWHSFTLLFFDTVCDIQVFCPSEKLPATRDAISRAFASCDERFSPGSQPLSDPLVLELYQKALQVNQASAGSFDITVGPLLDLWGFSSRAYRIPLPEEVKAVVTLVGMGKINLKENTLVLPPGVKLDWGGIAKGWGVDLAAQAAFSLGITHGFINAGGDLYCWGRNPDHQNWRVGIKNPREPGYLGVISVTDSGVATSGDYQRYFERNGRRYHHLFDPKTGYPAQGKRSVTVVGPETALCDALSTALFVGSSPEAIIRNYPAYGAILVDDRGNVVAIGKPFPFNRLDRP